MKMMKKEMKKEEISPYIPTHNTKISVYLMQYNNNMDCLGLIDWFFERFWVSRKVKERKRVDWENGQKIESRKGS